MPWCSGTRSEVPMSLVLDWFWPGAGILCHTGCSIMFYLCFQHGMVGLQPKQTCSFPRPRTERGWWHVVWECENAHPERDNETFRPRECESEHYPVYRITNLQWWRHQIETFSVLLALCKWNPPAPLDSLRNGQWRGTLMFSLICARTNGWANNQDASDWDAIALIMTSL